MRARACGCAAGLLLLAACGAPPAERPAAEEPPAAAGPAWFVDEAEARGLRFRHVSGHTGRFLFPEIMGGGAALFDADGDGDLDAYLVQSGSVTGASTESNRLYLNDGGGRFRDATEGSGAGDSGYGNGVAAGDYDGDGDVDLYVTNYGPNVLLRNDGGGTFTDVTAAAGVGHDGWGTSTTFLDFDADGDLDLFVVNYVNWSPATEQNCYNAAGRLDYCLPTNYNTPAADVLYRNEGDGRFTDVSQVVGLNRAFGNGLGVVAADFDGNGAVDVFVANDTMLDQLWMNQGGGRFVDESLLRGCALDEHGRAKAGMGVASEDIDDDGDADLLVVNLESQTDSFFLNDGAGFFTDFTGEIGLGSMSRWFTRFGIGLHDFDNDGRLDLYQANGRVTASAEPTTDDPFAEPNVLFAGGEGGRFVDVRPQGGTREALIHSSRAAAFGDVDDDGGVDVLVVNRDAPAYLLHNVVSDRGHWIRFRVVERSGADALGARLTLSAGTRRVARYVRSGYSYQSSSDPRVHVGLGEVAAVEDVTVTWVDGRSERYGDHEAGRTVVLRRGEGTAPP